MPDSFGLETQADSAQRMYNARASNYEDSWHPDYSRRFMELVPLQPGDRVLDLCCGTGLEAFLAAEAVGPEGEVLGVDITHGMLEQLRRRQEKEPAALGARIRTVQHDVTNLADLVDQGVVTRASFDAILCSCAFVLFDEPAKVVAHWKEFLRPGGLMAIDISHEHSLRSGIVLERVARDMGLAFPSNRSWVKSKESFKDILEAEGMQVEDIVLLEKVSGTGSHYFGADEADGWFEQIVNSSLTRDTVSDDFKTKARPLFKKAWEKAGGADGKVEDRDALYLYISKKPE